MTIPIPFRFVDFVGDGTMRGVTLALPTDRVRNFLPNGLELGEQSVTPKGTHPVILFFHDMFRSHMSIPTLLPSITYREHSVGIPFTYMSRGSVTPGKPGPYYFMPKLYLDSLLWTLGGLFVYGYPKELASMQVATDHYTITSLAGQRVTSLAWKPGGDGGHRPITEYANFEPVRQMLNQPVISVVPASLGPFFILSDFDKDWDAATLQPMRTCVEVDVSYVPGYECGRYPAADWSLGIDESVLGSYELRAPFRLSMPYWPLMSFGRGPG